MEKLASVYKKYGYFLGICGFIGLLYFKYNDPSYLIFFSFFGFTSLYWFSKYSDIEKDEIYTQNYNKARLNGMSVFVVIVFLSACFTTTYLGQFLSVETKYAILVATISLSFSILLILEGYLFDKYQRNIM